MENDTTNSSENGESSATESAGNGERWAVYRTREPGKGWIYGVRRVHRGIPGDKAERVTRVSTNRREQQRFAKALNG